MLAWAQGGEAKDGRRASGRPPRQRGTRDIFVYFDNDAKVRAPLDAQALSTAVEKRIAAPRRG